MNNRFPRRSRALALAVTLALPAGSAFAAAPSVSIQHVPGSSERETGAQRFIVKYRNSAVASLSSSARDVVLATAARRASTFGMTTPRLQAQRRMAGGAMVVSSSRRLQAAEAQALVRELRADPQVEYAQIDYRLHALAVLPDDPMLATHQWDMQDAQAGIYAPVPGRPLREQGVVVAVLDTGILPHADLQGNVVPGYDMVSADSQDGDGRDADPSDPGDNADGSCPSPSSFHGTHVAGTVAAVADNGIGVAGVAWKAKVQPVRVLGACGSGYMSDIADGVVWASGGHVDGVADNANPAEVINAGLGGAVACSEVPAMQEAINAAVARGTTVVVAAGNGNNDVSFNTPAGCSNVIAVGATNSKGVKTSYSSFGLGVALSAPGGDEDGTEGAARGLIWSTGDTGQTVPLYDNAYVGMAGTSMASPHVAGIVALMQSAALEANGAALTPAQVATMLRQSARPFPSEQSRPIGNGIADASRAVLLATGQTLPEPPTRELSNGIVLSGQTGEADISQIYSLQVPAGTRSLNLRTMGGSGDVSLYASLGSVPDKDTAQYVSEHAGNAETIIVNRPQAGTWYVRVRGNTQYRGLSVLGLAR